MTKIQNDIDYAKSGLRVFFEYALLAICLCLIAIRVTYTESPTAQLASQMISLSDSIYSLTMSAILIFSFLIWLVVAVCNKKFIYRFTGMEVGFSGFILAAIAAGIFAANKRAAITDSAMLIAPIFMAILLVQILDKPSRITVVLVAISALGVVCANQCAFQAFASNPAMVEQYQNSPEKILVPLGIAEGSYEHMMLEHRIFSQDVRGFFTTSNSAGAFFILAMFAAAGLVLTAIKNRKENPGTGIYLPAAIISLGVILFGLVLTKSKGAIAAFLVATLMFVVYLLISGWLKKHRRIICLVSVLAVVLACGVVVGYGVKHHSLPGGNSMLVRWQYWTASAKMFMDNPFTGVGGGNFGSSYTMYKPAGALEVVSDPHNLPLSIATRFGLFGLLGFFAIILCPLWRTIFPKSEKLSLKPDKHGLAFEKLSGIFLIVISIALLIVRPILMQDITSASFDAMFLLYIIPVAAFGVGFWLFGASQKLAGKQTPGFIIAAMFCATAGVLAHSMVDYAIFEPGVLATFFAVLACMITMNYNKPAVRVLPGMAKISVVVLSVAIMVGYLHFAFIPVAKAGAKMAEAMKNPAMAISLLQQAAEDDRLDPSPVKMNAKLHWQIYSQIPEKNEVILKEEAGYLQQAIDRSRIDYKNYEKLSEIYFVLWQTVKSERADYLNKAFVAAQEAIKYYPNSGQLHYNLAKFAEQLGREEIAIENYRQAVEIEDCYREQFRIMYPGREMYSRLGEANYNYALERLEKLRGEAKQP